MADNPPSYDNSFADVKNVSSSLPTLASIKEEKSRPNSLSVASASSKSAALLQNQSGWGPARNSFLTRLRDTFWKRPRDGLIESIVMDDVHTAVQPYSGSAADRVAMLDSCAQLCTRYKIDFSLLLQEKSIQDHTVLYWALVNGPWPPRAPFELVAAVLAYSAPLKPETIQEARQACVSLRSQEMFQFLRMCPTFGALSLKDRFLLGTLVPPEEIVIEPMEDTAQSFSVEFRIPHFLKRMSLSRPIKLEFIARGSRHICMRL
ncbi:hypothetical protein B0H19DRAFT_173774 [Mycena capillaripes]|nr:hypothetical protein B0H19DRAFT_173774 [Mycena capillaripes]